MLWIVCCSECFYVTLLTCAYFKTASDYFFILCIKTQQTVILLSWVFVLKFSGFVRFAFFCLSLSLNSELRKIPPGPGKIVSWKKILIERLHTPYLAFQKCRLNINPQYLKKQNSLSPQIVYPVRNI